MQRGSKRSPDGAQRNPGLPRGVDAAPDFAPLHPGYFVVMPALVAGIHDFTVRANPKTWMAGTSPAMTVGGARRHVRSSLSAILSRSHIEPDIVIDQGKT
jgi:hypothetical protein